MPTHNDSADNEHIQQMINRFNRGDLAARELLIEYAADRLKRLTRRIMAEFAVVRKFEQTDDVLQRCLLNLFHSLENVRPQNVRAFMGLAALQIRRKLIDLARHYSRLGEVSIDALPGHLNPRANSERMDRIASFADPATSLDTLRKWTDFHECVDKLPDDEREVFQLTYYQGLKQQQVAEILGVSERTVKRIWRSAKIRLHELLGADI